MYLQKVASRKREISRRRRRRWTTPVAVLTVGAIALSLAACTTSGHHGGPTDAASTGSRVGALPPTNGVLQPKQVTVGVPVSLVALQASTGSTSSPGAWRLVTKPPNSHAVLGAAPDSFKPDVPGEYVLQLGDGTSSADHLVLSAAPSEQLVCVNTRAWTGDDPSTAHIRIGTTDYPRSGPGLQVVVLARSNLGEIQGVQPNQTFAPTADGYAHYATFLSQLTSDDLVFINGTVNSNDMPSVWGPLARLGAADLPEPFPSQDIPFSFIGIPGLVKGQGWQAVDGNQTQAVKSRCNTEPDSSPYSGPDAGLSYDPTNNLAGWLTTDSHLSPDPKATSVDHYTYLPRDDVAVDTNAKAASGEHAILVGNQTYTIQIGDHSNGWHALVLERDSLCSEDAPKDTCQQAAPLFDQGFSQDNGGFAAMATALQRYVGNPDYLLIVAPYTGANGWLSNTNPPESLIGELRTFGASPMAPGRAFADAKAAYALIGGGDRNGLPAGSAPESAAESFTGFGDTGHLTGYLTRDNQNRFGPGQVSSANVPVQGLSAIAYGPTTDWPSITGDDAYSKAYRFLSARVGYAVTDENPLGIRGDYTVDHSWSNANTAVSNWSWAEVVKNRYAQEAGGDEATYNQVRQQLYAETQEANNLRDWVDAMRIVLLGDDNKITPLFDKVTTELKDSFPPPNNKSELTVELLQGFLGLAKNLPEIGEVAAVAGELLDVGLKLGRAVSGEPEDIRGKIFDTGQQMQDAALSFLHDSGTTLNHLWTVIASDPHKLAVLGHKTGGVADLPGTLAAKPGPWELTGDQENEMQDVLTSGLERWLLPNLVGTAFKIWQIAPARAGSTQHTYECHKYGIDALNWHPFGRLPDDAWMQVSNGTHLFNLALAGTQTSRNDMEYNKAWASPSPTQALLDTLFNPLTGLGLNRAWFFEQGFDQTQGVTESNGDRVYYVNCVNNTG